MHISQAFDKVWHKGLLYKIRRSLLLNYFLILKTYLSNRHFIVKVNIELTDLTPVNVGVPQGSDLGPLLYLLYTADLPTSPDFITAKFADDTADIVDSQGNTQRAVRM
jgi:retron-type reverse transcriptase